MRLSLEIGCAGVKGMQTNVYLSETLDALMMDANLRDWAASPRRGSPRAKTSWRSTGGYFYHQHRVRRIGLRAMSTSRRSCCRVRPHLRYSSNRLISALPLVEH